VPDKQQIVPVAATTRHSFHSGIKTNAGALNRNDSITPQPIA